MNFFGSKSLIGIDVGSQWIKIAEVDFKEGKESKLKSFCLIQTPPGVFYGSELQDVESLGLQIKNALKEHQFHSKKKLCIGIGGLNSVNFRKIQIPKVDPKLIAPTVRYEIEQYLSGDVKSYVIGFAIQTNANDESTLTARVAIAQRFYIEKFLFLESILQRQIEVIDYSAFALTNAILLFSPELAFGSHLHIHIGHSNTYLIFINQGQVEYVREIAFSGCMMTLELQRILGISFEEAESIKVNLGSNQEWPEGTQDVLDQLFNQLLEEIENAMPFFMNAMNDPIPIEGISLSGGASLTAGLKEKISSRLSCPVELLSIQNPKVSLGKNQPEQIALFGLIAFALACRKSGDTK